ncbi:hypothetical protein V6Z12_A09G158400 [Gossypium hirsutum]
MVQLFLINSSVVSSAQNSCKTIADLLKNLLLICLLFKRHQFFHFRSHNSFSCFQADRLAHNIFSFNLKIPNNFAQFLL